MPTHRKLFRFRLLLSLSLAYGCSGLALTAAPAASAAPPVTQPAALRPLSPQEIDQLKNSGLVDANNRFSWQLFQRICQTGAQRNQFVSPLSAAFALQMALQGANGTTAAQIRQVLGLGQIGAPQLQAALPLLLRKLQRPAADITLEIADSLWANQRVSFDPGFIQRVGTPFGAQIANVDMADPATAPRINAWTSQATHGKIPRILDRIEDPDTVAFLINAIYFKADWTEPFDKAETADKPFTLLDGSHKPVSMMRHFGRDRKSVV